jgi:hypothetical protein
MVSNFLLFRYGNAIGINGDLVVIPRDLQYTFFEQLDAEI